MRRERASESRNERSELNNLFYCRKERKRYANLHTPSSHKEERERRERRERGRGA